MSKLSFLTFLFPHKLWAQKKCKTRSDILGPYYKPGAPIKNDLSQYDKSKVREIIIKGIIYKGDCKNILEGAIIDIWHANPSGQYDNSQNGYAFRGKVISNEKGQYNFTTNIPGYYASRPKHIHIKVHHESSKTLITQLYFEGDKKILTDATAIKNYANERVLRFSKNKNGEQEAFFNFFL